MSESEDLKTLLQTVQEAADTLVKEFEVYTEKVNSRTDAQSSKSLWDWLFFWRSHTKTDDQLITKESERTMQTKFKEIKRLIERCQKGHDDLTQRNSKTLIDLQQQNRSLRAEISAMKGKTKGEKKTSRLSHNPFRKAPVIVQLYCEQQAEIVPTIMTKLERKLYKRLSKDNIKLMMQECASAKDVKTDLPLIVLCLHASRLGPDISDAIREIQRSPYVAVLIVHHKDHFAQPSERSDQILQRKEYSEIGAIIDISFLEGKGIYHCDMNKNAIKELANFVINITN